MPWIRVVTESNNHIVYWNGFIGKKKKDSKENDVMYGINLDNQFHFTLFIKHFTTAPADQSAIQSRNTH